MFFLCNLTRCFAGLVGLLQIQLIYLRQGDLPVTWKKIQDGLAYVRDWILFDHF
jgi:hypothetical protein